MQLTTCPSSEQLSDYLSGKLSAQEIEEISLHIETCVDCDTAVNKLDDDSDSLMFALRQPLGEELFEQEPELQRAVAAMRLSLPESESQNSCTVLGTVREYDLLEKIGQGGMGTVYKALHSRLKRIVALKVLADHRLGDPAAVDRFSREMQAVGKLAHPNIVRALDAGEAEGRHYLVMEYIDGIDLSRLSRRCGPLPVAEASELVLQVSLALQHAHEHGLVHRDIKPSNVMLTRDGNVKLLDLGIALLQPDEPATSDLTGTGQVMGTLDYMAPEQLDNTHAVDIRADVYGLGATLYKLLCGSAPATDSQSRFRLPGESIPPVPNIGTIRGDIPKPVAAVIQRMLAPNPDQRYDTPADVAEALKPFAAKSNLKQLALAAAADAPSRTMTPPKRFGGRLGRFVIAAAALLGMTLAGFAIYVETDKGQIVIHSNVDDIQVLVKRTGKLYDALDELEVDKGDNQWKFRSGSYEVQLLGKTDGLRVKDGVFTLTRDGKAVVTIERDPARAKTVVSGPVYEGKTLDEWLVFLKAEKFEPSRLRAIPAVEVLGVGAPDKAIEALIEVGSEYSLGGDLSTQRQEVALRSVQAIQKLSGGRIPQGLIDAFDSEDVKTRRFVVSQLAWNWRVAPPNSLAEKAIRDPDSMVRKDATRLLGGAAVPELIIVLGDDEDDVRRTAAVVTADRADLLKKNPDDVRTIETKLYAMLHDNDPGVRSAVLRALSKIATDQNKLVATLASALSDPDYDVRNRAIQSLGNMGPQAASAVPKIIDALKNLDRTISTLPPKVEQDDIDNYASIQQVFITYVGRIGPGAAAAVPVIKEFLQHDDGRVRSVAVQAIKQITGEVIELPEDDKTPGNKTAKGPVYGDKTLDEWIALLKTQRSAAARHTAVEPIETLGVDEPEKAIAALIEAGSDYDPRNMEQFEPWFEPRSIWIAINSAIKRLSPSQIPVGVVEALADEDIKKRRFATSLIEQYKDVVPPIEAAKKAAADSDEYVRSQTLEWVDRYDSEAIPILIAAFNDQSEQVRRRAAAVASRLATSGNTSPEDAKLISPKLYEMLHDKDAQIRADSLTALSRFVFDQDKLLTELIEAVGDSDPKVKSIAIQSLGALGPKAEPAVSVLVASLKQCSRKTLKPKDILTMYSVTHAFRDIAPERLIIALGSIGPSAQSAVPTIKEFLKHDDVYVRNAVVEAIQQITGEVIELPKDNKTAVTGPVYDGKTFDEWVTLLKNDKSPQRQIEGIKALVALGTAENASRALEIVFEMGASHSIERQNDDDREVVSAALEAIARINDAKLVRPFLLGKLDSEDAGARLFAITVLNYPLASGRDPNYSEKTLAQIYAMSGDPAVRVRLKLIELLGRLASFAKNGESPVPTLIKMYETDKDQQVRYAAFHSLAALGDKRAHAALPLFLDALSSPDATIRKYAVSPLETSKPDPKLLNEALLKALRSEDEQIRFEALQLARILVSKQPLPAPSTALLPVFIQGLKDSEQKNRKAASDGLLRFRPFPKEVTSNLVDLMDNTEDPQRSQLILLLGEYNFFRLIGEPSQGSVVAELMSLYQRADAGRRTNILWVFARMGVTAKSALPLVETALKDKDLQVRAAAEEALKAIKPKQEKVAASAVPKTSGPVYDGKTFDEWVTQLNNDKSPQRQIEGIKALVALGMAQNASRALEIVFEMGASHSIPQQTAEDQQVIVEALLAISRIKNQVMVQELVAEKLNDNNEGARLFALNMLTNLLKGGQKLDLNERTRKRLVEMADDPAVQVREELAVWLVELVGKSAVPALIQMSEKDKNETVRRLAFRMLALVGEIASDALPLFLAGVLSSDERTRDSAYEGIGNLKPDAKQLNEALLKALGSDDENVRRDVMGFLNARLRFPQASPELLPVIIAMIETRPLENKGRNRADLIRSQIRLNVFDKFPDEVTIAIVRKLESAEEPDRERWHSAMVSFSNGLGGFPANALIVDELVHLYQDADVSRRVAILQLLGALRASVKPATALYETALKDKDPEVRAAAEAALKAIRSKSRKTDSPPAPKISGPVYDGRTFDEWVTLLKTDRSAQRQLEGIKALASLRSDENTPLVVSTIIKIAGDGDRISTGKNDPNVAESAEAILKQIGQEAAVPQLLTALESEDVTMRRFAVNALDRFEITEEVAPAILKLPEDDDIQVRLASTRLLRQAGEPGVAALAKMVEEDKSDGVRARAANSLAVLEDKAHSAVPALLGALSNDDMHVQMAVQLALRQIKPDQKLLNNTLLKLVADDAPISIRVSPLGPFGLVDENSTATLPALIAGMADEDKMVRYAAGGAFRKLKATPDVLPALIAAVQDEKHKYKIDLAKALARYGAEARAAMPALIKLYETSNDEDRRQLLYAYEKIDLHHKDVQPLLHQAAQSEDQNLSRAAQKLLRVDTVGAVAAAVSLTIKVTADGKLSIGDKSYDLQALKTLLAEQIKQAGERGVAVRIDAAAEVRFDAVNTLIDMCKKAGVRNVSLGTTKVAPAAKNDGAAVYDGKTFDEWLSILKTETNPAKLAPVITAVGATGARGREREATEAILNVAKLMIAPFNESLYSNEDEKKLGELYNAINIALTRIGAPHATDALIEAVNAPHLGMRRHAQQVLYEWTMSEEYADQIFAALKHNDPKLREWAVAQLAKMADSGVRNFDEIVAQLFEIISKDKSLAMRRAAAEELRRLIGNPNTGDRRAQIDRFKARRIKEVDGALEQLYSLAKDQDPTVRFCVLWVLTRIEADPATLIPLLADAAGDKKSATQQLVIDELSNLAPRLPTAIAALIASYPRFGADERIRVVNAFGHKGTIAATAIPLLKEAAKSDDQLLREAAVEALKKLEPSKQ